MKFLVLGATGMAGHTICLYLRERGHDVTAYSRTPFPYCDHVGGDLKDMESLRSLLLNPFDAVINAIGVLNQACDAAPSNAVYMNSLLPHLIADLLKDTDTKLIQMSTDCVFSGKSAPYSEHSLRDGETMYDRTKALGEVDDCRNVTFRNSIIGPDMKADGIGLFNWFMKQQGTISGYTGAIWTGVTTLTLAKAMEQAAAESVTGIYNLVNNESISKYQLLRLFNKHLRGDRVGITACDSVNIDKSLRNNRTDFTFQVPDYETMIIEMKQWIMDHRSLYPHYEMQLAGNG